MADRYWVGGTATWDATAGTKWSDTDGGAGGASVPTAADAVFFTALSGAVTCTVSGTRVAQSINFTGFTGTLAGTATPALTLSGSLTLVAGMTLTYNGTTTFNATATITSAGKTLGPVTINGSGITVTLGDALNIGTSTLVVTQGTFNTNNFNITASALSSSNTNVRAINLGTSTVTLSGASFAFSASVNTNLTFDSGTSSIVFTNTSAEVIGGTILGQGLNFYNISFTATTSGTVNIIGLNTFNNFSVTATTTAGNRQIALHSRQTINGILSTTGTSGNRRIWFRGLTYGLAQTLTINAAPNLTDTDFRDIYVAGSAAPIGGTRIGNLGGNRNITFSTPKTVYWNLVAGGNWSSTGWAATSGGTPNDTNYPLAQDTAIIEDTGLNTSGQINLNSAVGAYIGTIDMSNRTSAVTINFVAAQTVYGNWKNGAGTSFSGSTTITFSGRTTQTITSAGKTFPTSITVDSFDGSVELADGLNIGTTTLTVTNGTFNTKNFAVTAGTLSSSSSNYRTIILGSGGSGSTVNLSSTTPIVFTTSTNLTVVPGNSQINLTSTSAITFAGGGASFSSVSFTGTTTAVTHAITGQNTFANLTFNPPDTIGVMQATFSANQTITGTLTANGAIATPSNFSRPSRRIFLRSSVLGTQRTFNIGTLSATHCDFRDIVVTGGALNSSQTGAGDCGGNSGITFPAAKTVTFNGGNASFGDSAYPGGAFPLAQDTLMFVDSDNINFTFSIDGVFNIGTMDFSQLTTGNYTVTFSSVPVFYGGLILSGRSPSFGGTSTLTFCGRGSHVYSQNGISTAHSITVDNITGTLTLGSALSMNAARTLTLTSGTFDAATYNVTTGVFSSSSANTRTLKMGSGTWTLSATGGTLWNIASTNLNFYKGTANIVLSSTSTGARTFTGGSLSYNKLTIGGASGISTLTISDDNQFTELASTKTVAHTIALGTTTQTFGKWTVTGTANNVVTLTGTGTNHVIAGTCTGTPGANTVNYLAMGSIGFAATSPGEFYAGVNSTGTAGPPVYRTARPFDSTRYWVGGTGNWSDTNRWSTSSGGIGGAVIPRSHDDVVFNNLSNATAYTATVDAVTGGVRVKALTITGPASGNVTLAGTTRINIHGNVTLPATGMTRTHTGGLVLSGSTTGLTFTTNGVAWTASGANVIEVNGVDCGWTLGSAADLGTNSGLLVFNGSFSTANYPLSAAYIDSQTTNKRTLNLGSSTVTLSGFSNPVNFGITESIRADLTFSAGTSQINIGISNPTINGNNQTFYNVAFTSASAGTVTLNGINSFNNLSFTGIISAGLKDVVLTANQTVAGTLTFSAGTNATMRHFCRSNSNVFPRTITAAAVSMTDVDFRDITIAGAAAPASGTRIGDCKNNSGITFTPAANKYWNLLGGGTWSTTGWATTSGGSISANNFPLAQDTCFFEATGLISGGNVTIDQNYNIGTINMSARTANTMTLATGTTTPTIYGNWINGTGTTLSGTGIMTFAGRSSQTITSAGRTFTQRFTISVRDGSVALADSLTISNSSGGITLESGTLDAVVYNVTFSNGGEMQASSGSATRVVAIGSGTWTTNSSSAAAWNTGGTNVTITGTGTISLTGTSFKTFTGGGKDYSGITLNQGGQGTLTITGNNTFKSISSSTSFANTISLGTTTQTINTSWTAGGANTANILTITGTDNTSSPANLIFTGVGTAATVNNVDIIGIRAYPSTSQWNAVNSTNSGNLGWTFITSSPSVPSLLALF